MTQIKKILAFVIIFSSILLSGSGWKIIQGNSSETNTKIFFVDSLKGFTIGTNIYKTIDAGKTWNKTFGYYSNWPGLFHIDSSFWIRVGTGFGVEISTNQGESWVYKLVQYGKRNPIILNSVYFSDKSNGWAVGGNYVIKTTDGGNSWSFQDSTEFTIYSISFCKNIGIIVGTYGKILSSFDGGNSWQRYSLPIGATMLSACFIDSNIVFIGGAGGAILKSINRPTNYWDDRSIKLLRTIHDFHFIDKDIGWAVGSDGFVAKTIDGGNTWIEQLNVTKQSINSIYFFDSARGFAVGDSGIIVSTENGGVATGINNNKGNSQSPLSNNLYQCYPNPFNPETKIEFQLSSASFTTVIVFNVLGQPISTLVNKYVQAGFHEVTFDGRNYPSGVYYYRINTETYSDTKSMLLLK